MKPLTFMVIAGEASGDSLAAGLVQALREQLAAGGPDFTTDYQPLNSSLAPRFFGAGGPAMQQAGVELAFDLTAHSLIGLSEAVKQYFKFRRFAIQLRELARQRRPDAIICVDFGHFNRKFAQSIRRLVARPDWFHDWQPKIIQYVSPQVWASRESRVYSIAREFDMVLSIFPFEKAWYAKRVPDLPVEFVGHPLIDRFGPSPAATRRPVSNGTPIVLLLPGSRPGELRRHLPLLLDASRKIAAARAVQFLMVLPHESLREISRPFEHEMPNLLVQMGGLEKALAQADVALTKSGTITMECAYFGVPAVVFYKTSFITYVVGRQIVKVKYLAMPNLLADEPIYPEFVQSDATPENLAHATLELVNDTGRRQKTQGRLAQIISGLGPPGANHRAAKAILKLLGKI